MRVRAIAPQRDGRRFRYSIETRHDDVRAGRARDHRGSAAIDASTPSAQGGSRVERDPTLSFAQTVRRRRSVRAFLERQVPKDVIRQVLEDAQLAPSNCNTQPWSVHVVSGSKRHALSAALVAAATRGDYSSDFSFKVQDYGAPYDERQQAQSKAYLEALAIEREDAEGRRRASMRNYRFFDAPHVILLSMPSVGDNVRVAADIGMYAQTLLLSLAARGLGGVAQTSLGMFATVIRQELSIPEELRLLFGISFGYPDPSAPTNGLQMKREPVSQSVTWYG